MTHAVRPLLLAALLLAAYPRAASADILLRQRESAPAVPGEGGDPIDSEKEIALSKDRMRITDLTSGSLIIVRLDLRVLWEIPPGRGEYIEIPFEYLQRMSAPGRMTDEQILENQLELAEPSERPALRAELEEARKTRAPETPRDRALSDSLAEAAGKMAGKSPTVTWSGRTAKMIGFTAREAVLSVDGAKVAEVWVTNDPFFRDEVTSYREVMATLGAGGGGGPEVIASLGGFPLKTVLFPVGKSKRPPLVIEITEASRESFSPWDFDLPPGLERARMLPPTGQD